MRDVLIGHIDEIALKGGRRPYYEKRLGTGIRNALRDLDGAGVDVLHDRVLVTSGKTEIPVELLLERLSRVFGIKYVLRGVLVEATIDDLQTASLHVAAGRKTAKSFGFRVRRAPASLGVGSAALAAALGSFVVERTGLAVDLTAPDLWIDVGFLGKRAFVAGERVEGPGGLPIGTAGHGVALVSGGIDSPVAAWMMMSRGLKISAVHFHSAPFTGPESQEKVRDLLLSLTRWQPTIEVAFIPFADTQKRLIEATPPRLRVILYRRFMVRIAQALAAAVEATCLVTGDALAQVASQTVGNLATIDAAASVPILRPLIGMGKDEVISRARRLGTYETSIRPHDDCCAFLLPESVATTSTAAELAAAEADLPIDTLVADAVRRRDVFSVRFEDGLSRAGMPPAHRPVSSM